VFATGGLTQKQSLRGLLLRHPLKVSIVLEVDIFVIMTGCLLEEETVQNYFDTFSTSAVFGPEGAKSLS